MRPLKRILIADDHALFRKGVRLLLADAFPKADLRDVDSLDAALEFLSAAPVDLAILDLRMPGMSGAESLRAVREAYPGTAVLVLSGSDARQDVLSALGAGVHGYVVKASPDAEVLAAIERVRRGQVYVPPQLASATAETAPPASDGIPAAFEGLTPRQKDVLRLLATGKSNKEIARELDLAEGTVKIHLAAVLRFLKARNRTEAAVLASRFKL
jgi:DNA-binding NarL/FixJ family response regulator